MVTLPPPVTRGFNCANCGAAVELRALTRAVSVACTSCGAILDPRDPTVVILQTAALLQHLTPKIPLGTRGTWHGHPFEVVGFQRREIEVDDETFGWDEYVLFNPYQGFRYLTEYDGHWNDVRTVRDLPESSGAGRTTSVRYGDTRFRHFQAAGAVTRFVLGEFPWRVRAGDRVHTDDFIAPPLLLSRETTDVEATWSLGTYVPGSQVWSAFAVDGEPPAARGVFANQPSPFAAHRGRLWRTFALLGGLLLLLLAGRALTAAREEVFRHDYVFASPAAGESAFVTDPFTITRGGTLAFDLRTDLRNSWVYFDLALINLRTGEALNVGREIGAFAGEDADGPWQEGSPTARVLLPAVEAGEYYLRVEPEGPPGGAPVPYTLTVRRDVPSLWPYGIALVVLLVVPVFVTIRAAAFESRRWMESSHTE